MTKRAPASLRLVGAAPSRLEIHLLGAFALVRDGRPVDIARWQRRPATLLRLLAASGGRVTRDDVIEFFWPESTPEKGATNLRQVLYQLRRELGADPPPVIAERGWVELNPALDWQIDLARFQTAVESARDDLTSLDAALELYGGEPLPEDRYEDWAAPVREQAQQTYRQAVLKIVRLYRQAGEGERALKRLGRLLDADPLDEVSVRLQLEILAETGRRADALKTYARFKERLRSELDLNPEPETAELVDQITKGDQPRPERIEGRLPEGLGPEVVHPSAGPATEGAAGPSQVLPIGGFLGSLPTGTFVAREQELRAGLSAIDKVEKGTGRLVLLAGEAGVGKTRLGQELTLALWKRGFGIAAGSCYQASENSAFGPFLEAAAMLFRLSPAHVRAEIPQRWPYLAALLPSEALPVPPASTSEGTQDRLHWSVSGFIQALAAVRPLALLLDDLHWGDSSSLDLLRHLAHHTRRDRVLILGTYRDTEVGRQHPLDRTLYELDRQALTQRIEVRRLSPEDTSALIAAKFDRERVSEEFAGLLYERTEGNPFFLQQVLHDLVERGDLYQDKEGWQRKPISELEVPVTVRAAVAQRLERMAAETQDVLRRASVLGRHFQFEELLGLTELEENRLELCLDEAANTGLVTTLSGDAYDFDHALTCQALYSDLSPRRRRKLHRAAGEVLARLTDERLDGRLAEVAWHFLQADEPRRALWYGLRAGDAAAAIYAHADAELQYQRAAELARGLGDQAAEAVALEQQANVLFLTARYLEQLEVANRAAELYRRLDDLEGEGRVIARTARVYFFLRRMRTMQEGIDRLEELLSRFDGRPASPAHFALYENLVTLSCKSGMREKGESASERALAMARELGDDRLMARAWGRRGLALSGVEGRQEEVERATLEAIRLAEKAGDLDALHIALNNASSHYLHIGNRARSRQYAERKMTVARRLGSPWALAVALADWSDDLYERGDTEGWRSFREQTLEVVQRSELPALRGYLTIPGELLMVEGSTDEACTLFEKCLADGEREGNSLLVEEAQRNLAELHRLEGRLDQARRFYETLLQRPELDAEAKYPTLVPLVAALLEMRTEDGTAEARHYMSDVHVADRSQHPLWFTARMQVAAGWLAAREGSCSEASRLIEESLDILRSNQLVVQEGEVLVCYGLALAELGENKASNERLTEAAELFRRIGHILHLRRAERLQMRVEAGESGNTPPG